MLFFKKIFSIIAIIIIVFSFSITAISAIDSNENINEVNNEIMGIVDTPTLIEENKNISCLNETIDVVDNFTSNMGVDANLNVLGGTERHIGIGQTYATLEDALNASSNGDTFIIHAGIYNGNGNVKLVINKEVNIQNYNTDTVIFDGNYNSYIWNITSSNVNITNIIFQRANYSYYGAICNYGVNCSLYNCSFFNNSARGVGGAMHNVGINFTVSNCSFFNNSARSGGGAIYNNRINFSVSNCYFFNNKAYDETSGGAIYEVYAGSTGYFSVCNCSFFNNTAENGGALYIATIDVYNDVNLSVNNCSFFNNTAEEKGGAIYYPTEDIYLIVTNCSFFNNVAKRDGGAIYSIFSYIYNSTFVNNNIIIRYAISATLTILANNKSLSYDMGEYNLTTKLLDEHNNTYYYNGFNYTVTCSDGTISNITLTDEYFNAFYNVTNDYLYSITAINTYYAFSSVTVSNVTIDARYSFTRLQKLIGNYTGGVLLLNHSYSMYSDEVSTFVDGINITNDVSIDGNGFTIDANHIGRIFNVTSTGSLTLINTILINGNISGDGGVIYNVGYSSASNCSFFNNNAIIVGGAISNDYGGYFTVCNCSFFNCTASTAGGVIHNRNGNFTVNNSYLNNSISTGGGAIYNEQEGNFSVFNCSFFNNTANSDGGAIFNSAINLTVFNCSFFNNNVITYDGGAIYNRGNYSSVCNCSFLNNIAKYDGGAICNKGNYSSVCNCSFLNNTAENNDGGAIYTMSNYSSVCNCSFLNNTAENNGGAIYTMSNYSSVCNCSFLNNTADNDGEAIYNSTSIDISDSTFVNNNITAYNVTATLTVLANNKSLSFDKGVYNLTCKLVDTNNNNYYYTGFNYTISYSNGTIINVTSIDDYFNAIYSANSNELCYITANNTYYTFNSVTGTNVIINTCQNGFMNLQSLIDNHTVGVLFLNQSYKLYFYELAKFTKGVIITKNIVINGNGFTIDANNMSRIFNINNQGNLALINTSLINGNITDDGGAIYNSGGNFSVCNCSFFNNTVDNHGGAIYNSGGNFTVCNSSFFYNNARYIGGAIYNVGGNFTVCKSSFFNNNATIGGGAIYNSGGNFTKFNVYNCSFFNNTALEWGGAIYEDYGGSFSVHICSFFNNTATYGGGAIYNNIEYIDFSVCNCSFFNNVVKGSGGAIRSIIRGKCNFSVCNCSFFNNSAKSMGGAILNRYDNTVVYYERYFSVCNCSFFNNTVNQWGGAIYNLDNTVYSSNFSVCNCSFFNNTAHVAGAIYNYRDILTVYNCSFFNNAVGSYGGAIYNHFVGGDDGAIYSETSSMYIRIYDSSFINNTADVDAGAIYNFVEFDSNEFTNFSICGCYFFNNTAFALNNVSGCFGGAICNYACNFCLCNSSFFNNAIIGIGNMSFASESCFGGAICNSGNNFNLSNFSVCNCSFFNNTANRLGNERGGLGGAIYNSKSNLSVYDCSFINNNATKGESIYSNVTFSLFNSTFVNNNILGYNSSATLTVLANNKSFSFVEDVFNLTCKLVDANNNIYYYNGLNYTITGNDGTIINLTSNEDYFNASYSVTGNQVYYINATNTYYTFTNVTLINATIDSRYSFSHLQSLLNDYINSTLLLTHNYIMYSYEIATFSNGINITKAIIDANGFTIDANHTGRIFNVPNTSNLTLTNAVLINGNNMGGTIYNKGKVNIINCTFFNNTANSDGGAIYNVASNFTVSNCIFFNNSANDSGGAIYNLESNFIMFNCSFFNNSAISSGGAIYNTGINFTVCNSSFSNNTAYNNYGGAICNEGASYFAVSNSSFFNNTANAGGGAIYNYIGVNFTLFNCSFFNNNASTEGGVIYNSGNYFTVHNCSFFNNNVNNEGGVIFNSGNYFSLCNCSFFNNSASNGGVICNDYGAYFSVCNCSFFSNTASLNGGAIYNYNGVNCTVIDCNFTRNIGSSCGGAIYNNGSNFGVFNCSFFNNTVSLNGGVIFNSGVNCTVIYCNFTNNTESTCGAAIYNNGSNFGVFNCSFLNNFASNGGSIFNFGVNCTVIDCNFTNNIESTCGGAIYNNGSNFGVFNCSFLNNNADYGGAIYNIGVYSNLSNCSFFNNSAKYGGVIYNNGSNFSVFNCSFFNNSAKSDGGAIYNIGVYSNLSNCSFFNNNVSSSGWIIYKYCRGGAIYNNASNFGVFNCSFFNNFAKSDIGVTSNGGAIYNIGVYSSVSNCSFLNNNVSNCGGAIYNNASNFSACNCSFFNNTASSLAGAIYNIGVSSSVCNCSFFNNNADYGGVIYNYNASNFGVFNCSFFNNIANYGGVIYNIGVSSSVCNCSFFNNIAITNGGVIYDIGVNTTVTNSNFTNNTANNNGGSIYLTFTSSGTIKNCTIVSLAISPIYLEGTVYLDNNTINLNQENIPAITIYAGNITSPTIAKVMNNKTITLLKDQKCTINVIFLDNNNNTISLLNNKSNVTINNINYTLTSKGINHTYTHNFNNTGTYFINACTSHLTNLINEIAIMNVIDLLLILKINNVTYGINNTINLTLHLNDVLLNTTVNVTINGTNYTVNVTNGTGFLNTTILNSGNYTAVANYIHTDGTKINTTCNFTVAQATTIIMANSTNVTYGENVTIYYSVVNSNNTLAIIPSSENVTIIVIGKYGYNVTVVGNLTSNNIILSNLATGSYFVNVNYGGDENFTSGSSCFNFTVAQATTIIMANSTNVTYGENVTIYYSVVNSNNTLAIIPSSENVTIVVTDKKGNEIMVVGNLTSNNIILSNLAAGSYFVNVSYGGDENFTSGSSCFNFTVAQATTIIMANSTNVTYGENVTIYYSVNNTLDTIPESENVTIIVIGKDGYNVTVVGNLTSNNVILSDLASGSYFVNVSYAGDENFTGSNASFNFTVFKVIPLLDLTITNATFGNNNTIIVNLTGVNEGLSSNVKIAINNNIYVVNVINGLGSLDIKLSAGNYSAIAYYEGNDNYTITNASTTFIVFENIKFVLQNLTKYYNGEERLYVSLTKAGIGFANQTIIFSINGKNYTKTTNENGTASIAIKLEAGIYNATATYGNFISNSTVTILTTILSSDLNKVYRDSSQFNATFLDSTGKLLTNTLVTFNINGILYNKLTNGTGTASLNINLVPGVYVITSYNSVSKESKGNNVNIGLTIYAEDMIKYFHNGTQYTAIFTDSYKNPLTNTNVTFNIHGVFYTRTTDNEGKATLTIALDHGSYIITAYNPVTGEEKGNLIDVLPVLVASDVNKTVSETKYYQVKTLDGLGNPLTGQLVNINVNGVVYTKKTDINGVASLAINLKPGSYIITATWRDAWASNIINVSKG